MNSLIPQRRYAFYPCCASDILEPMEMLSSYVDEMIFCDIKSTPARLINENRFRQPTPKFIKGDVREVIKSIDRIDLLFYRRDTTGEGGSGIFVLGDSFFPKIMERFNPEGGLIITDGSNSRGGLFKKFKRASGLKKYGWHIQKTGDQPFLEKYGLVKFEVSLCMQ